MAKKSVINTTFKCKSCGAYYKYGEQGDERYCDLCIADSSEDEDGDAVEMVAAIEHETTFDS